MKGIALLIMALALAGCSSQSGSPETMESPSAQAMSGHAHSTEPVVPMLNAGPGERLITVGVPAGFTPEPPPGATDEYRCFVVDPGLQRDAMITGTEFLPDNTAIVHHAILFAVPPDQVSVAEQLDARDPGPGYECFGGSGMPLRGEGFGLDQSDWITAWAPGGDVNELPAGYGMPLPAGSRVIVQMHYNLRSEKGSDSTEVRLRLTGQDRKPLTTMLLPAPVELPCGPGETGRLCDREAAVGDVVERFGLDSGRTIAGLQLLCGGDPEDPQAGNTQTCDRRVGKQSQVFAVAGHMHLLGREISVTLNPGTPDSKVLLDIDNWDFDKQGAVPLEEPVTIRPGDTLRVRCRHDAGLRQQLPALSGSPARYVVWGEGTTDEMCLAIVING